MSVDIMLKPSRWLLFYLLIMHVLMLLVFILATDTFVIPGWLFVMMTVISFCFYYRRYFDINSNSRVRRIKFSDAQWVFETSSSNLSLRLLSATAWRWLIVMNMYCELTRRRQSVVIFNDSCTADEHRGLRALLRHYPGDFSSKSL